MARDREKRQSRPRETDMVENVIHINRVAKVVKGGRRFSFTRPHYAADAWGSVGIVKGRFMVMRRELLGSVRLPVYPPRLPVGLNDDIYVSLEIGKGWAVHWADEGLRDGLMDLPEGLHALSHRRGHMEEREAFCRWYARERLSPDIVLQ